MNSTYFDNNIIIYNEDNFMRYEVTYIVAVALLTQVEQHASLVVLYDDGGEKEVESLDDIHDAINNGCKIALELGFLDKIEKLAKRM